MAYCRSLGLRKCPVCSQLTSDLARCLEQGLECRGEIMSFTTSCRYFLFAVGLVALFPDAAMHAQTSPPGTQAPVWAAKPDIAAFESLENERLAAAQRAIEQILAVQGRRTVENTLAPFDEIVRLYDSAGYLCSLLQQLHPDEKYRDAATTMTSKVGAAAAALSLNPGVYRALAAVDLTVADPATRYYVQRQLLEFRLGGVDKDDKTRARLKELQDKLVDLQSAFDRNISD